MCANENIREFVQLLIVLNVDKDAATSPSAAATVDTTPPKKERAAVGALSALDVNVKEATEGAESCRVTGAVHMALWTSTATTGC